MSIAKHQAFHHPFEASGNNIYKKTHNVFCKYIYSIFYNDIKMKWREIWNGSQESSLFFTVLQDGGRDDEIVAV